MTDEFFTYNYTLRLQENNVGIPMNMPIVVMMNVFQGASMLLHKPFVKSEPPGVLHYDFYE